MLNKYLMRLLAINVVNDFVRNSANPDWTIIFLFHFKLYLFCSRNQEEMHKKVVKRKPASRNGHSLRVAAQW